jgi:hypothetical protein
MTHNVGTLDRTLRTLAGVGAVVWAFSTGVSSAAGITLVVLGAVLLATAAAGFCPLYRLLRISTNGRQRHGAR